MSETSTRPAGLENLAKSNLARLHPMMSRAYLRVLDTYGEAADADLLAELEETRRTACRLWQRKNFPQH